MDKKTGDSVDSKTHNRRWEEADRCLERRVLLDELQPEKEVAQSC